jgi:hypothetical protein
MKLFHISLDTDNLEKNFIPCVPSCAGLGEDEETPRICFAPSIEQCIQATHPQDYRVGQYFTVFELIVDENDPCLYYPEELYNKGLVPDALETQEFWLTKPVFLRGNVFKIKKIESERLFAWSCIYLDDLSCIIKSISQNPTYSYIIETSKSSEECYKRAMNFAEEIKDFQMIDECYDSLSDLNWSTTRIIKSLETELIYSTKKELV